MKHGYISALYQGARTGGDFFDVLTVPGTEIIVFLLLDIAGQREEALGIASHAQGVFRRHIMERGSSPNEADELMHLSFELNRAIIDCAGGAHFCPGFLASYNQELGILFYINAGHTPAIVRDADGVTLLQASGLPLGLFTHATHDAQLLVLDHGGALALVSRGLVESRIGGEEYGIARAAAAVERGTFADAHQLCSVILEDVKRQAGPDPSENDRTTMALVRARVARSAVSR
jgi:serine phosphatase RsbU (regulator of sigma subunit)